MNQLEAFQHELFGDGSQTHWHALAPPGAHRVLLCDIGPIDEAGPSGFGTDDHHKVKCLGCVVLLLGVDRYDRAGALRPAHEVHHDIAAALHDLHMSDEKLWEAFGRVFLRNLPESPP